MTNGLRQLTVGDLIRHVSQGQSHYLSVSQSPYIIGLSPVCLNNTFRFSDREKLFGNFVQVNGFSPECILLCIFKLPAIHLLHCSHEYFGTLAGSIGRRSLARKISIFYMYARTLNDFK